jgi:diadenosine tetraphosphate (Ap4A) HIT family hydrolase
MAECQFCNEEKYEKNLIKKYNFWKVILNPNQYYLGRLIIVLNRHSEDFLNTNESERGELFKIMKEISAKLKKIFNPDLFNYTILMNDDRHLHIHLIPRYKDTRIFENFTFKDENFGHYPKFKHDFSIPEGILNKIKEVIKR